MISDFISWCGDNYWWFVLGNFVLMFGLPLLVSLFAKERFAGYGQIPGCIVVLAFFQCLLGPVLYAFAVLGLIIMIIDYSSNLIKKINGRRS